MLPNKKQVRISIFFKILFPLLIALVLIQLLLFATVMPLFRPPGPPGHHGGPPRIAPEAPPFLSKQFENKIAILSQEKLPSLEKANSVRENGEDISYEGNSLWKTSPELPSWEELKPFSIALNTDETSFTGRYQDRHFYVRESNAGRLILFSPPFGRPNPILSAHFWIMNGLQVTLVLFLCYLILAWQLRPIKALRQAITELSTGNLSYRLKIKDSGEFGILGEGFNEMTQTLSSMLKAKEELVLGVSHELRSPLASALVHVELLKDEKRKKQIKTHLNRMESLIAELLESYRISSAYVEPKFEPVLIKELLIKMKEVHPDIKIEASVQVKSLAVDLDRRYFERLLSNLVENAIKYSKESKKKVKLSIMDLNDDLRFEILDEGPGIPVSDLENIFEPFYRADKSRNRETGGFGLGLFICLKITQMHNGKIWVKNLEKGCCFYVQIPRLRKKDSYALSA